MYPQLNFGLFTISAYSFFTAVALAAAVIGSYLYSARRGFKKADSLLMLLVMGVSAFIGARLFNVLVNFEWYRRDPSRIFSPEDTGFSLYGGILFAALAGLLIARARGINMWKFADTVTPFMGICIALMKIGCFLNGCCFGKETTLPWGVKFPPNSPAHLYQISQNPFGTFTISTVHPTQIYELLAALAGTALAFYIIGRRKKRADKTGKPARVDGTAFLAFAIFFSAFRWLNMSLRELPYSETVLNFWYPLFYATIIIICGFLIIRINLPNHSKNI